MKQTLSSLPLARRAQKKSPISLAPSRWIAVIAAALTLGFGTAYAAEGGMGAGGAGGWHHGWHGHQHSDGMMIMKELGKLHNELKLTLTPAQEQAWQNALQTMKQEHEAARADHEAARKQFEALSQQPVLDLNAMHDAHEKLASQERQRHEQVTAAWLKVYNSLNDQQKKVVSDDIKQRFARMMHRHEWMKQHQQGGAQPATPSQNQ
ncbi:Spy/CpxP family protein refolding chaperone [Trinickia acidisoli]|uniref:Spy/CpxP family protein refolding chaperone n=1 Tax=Trinickia acidisoli TaxID=2767482 RepID=UPI001A8E6EE4|nr:periplasmic heavy metal sensor [Trinickia acidisoli]